MGLSSSKTTTTSGPSKEAMPYLTQASGVVQNAYSSNQPQLDQISGDLGAAFKDYSARLNDNPTLDAARGYVSDTLATDHANPYLDNIVSTSNNDITDRINALFNKAGQSGSSRQIGELGKQLSANETNLRYTDFNNDQARKAAAVQQALALQQGDNQSALGLATLGDTAARVPYLGAQFLAGGLGNLWGNAQTTTQTQSQPLLGQLLNGAASIGSSLILASDRRLKEEIERIGEMSDGLPVYEYRYVGDPQFHIGVMADEVAEMRPWAVGPELNGFATVNYEAL